MVLGSALDIVLNQLLHRTTPFFRLLTRLHSRQDDVATCFEYYADMAEAMVLPPPSPRRRALPSLPARRLPRLPRHAPPHAVQPRSAGGGDAGGAAGRALQGAPPRPAPRGLHPGLQSGPMRPPHRLDGDPPSQSVVRREPLGVVAAITPWNYPLLMATWKARRRAPPMLPRCCPDSAEDPPVRPAAGPSPCLPVQVAPALAAGCCIVLKPSEHASLTCQLLCDIVAAAGVRRRIAQQSAWPASQG